ncbi:MAG: hypothetical protein GY802_28000 [Gammaproteobacteria bacterium]|nr:hypothetical protein [Gammaproteobacteria bacterium]
MRGGTHLVVTSDAQSSLIKGSFDLMVDDLDATRTHFIEPLTRRQCMSPG